MSSVKYTLLYDDMMRFARQHTSLNIQRFRPPWLMHSSRFISPNIWNIHGSQQRTRKHFQSVPHLRLCCRLLLLLLVVVVVAPSFSDEHSDLLGVVVNFQPIGYAINENMKNTPITHTKRNAYEMDCGNAFNSCLSTSAVGLFVVHICVGAGRVRAICIVPPLPLAKSQNVYCFCISTDPIYYYDWIFLETSSSYTTAIHWHEREETSIASRTLFFSIFIDQIWK